MFHGSSHHTLDGKGRVVLPAKFRYKLGETFMLTRGLNGCLWVFSEDQWKIREQKLSGLSMLSSNGLALQRFFLGSAVETRVDDQGRTPISAFLRDVAGIEKELVVVGAGDRIEVWARERWDAYNATLTDDRIEELANEVQLEL